MFPTCRSPHVAPFVIALGVAACEDLSPVQHVQPAPPSFDYNNSDYTPSVATQVDGGQGGGGVSAWTAAIDGPNGRQAIFLEVRGRVHLSGLCSVTPKWTVVRDSTGNQSYFFISDTTSHVESGDQEYRSADWQYYKVVDDGVATQALAQGSFYLGNCPGASGAGFSTHYASGPKGSFEVNTTDPY